MKKFKAFFREFRSLLLFVSLLMLFRTTYADWAPVPSGSMEPTILPGDVLWIDKTSYGPSVPFLNKRLWNWGRPQRGDIVTFIPPHENSLYVKRVIAVAGDTIRVEGNAITVNGMQLEQSVLQGNARDIVGTETISGREHAFKLSAGREVPSFGRTLVVPEGKLFVMGDHRNGSADSRFWGFADEAKVTGKVEAVAVSFAGERTGSRLAVPIR